MPVKVSLSPSLRNLDVSVRQRVARANQESQVVIQEEIRAHIQTVDPVASGKLLRSVRTLEESPTSAKVGSDLIQARVIETGRKPGKVPAWSVFKPILQAWASFRGLRLTDSQLYLVARKIAREGIKGRFPFRKAARTVAPKVRRVFAHALRGL